MADGLHELLRQSLPGSELSELPLSGVTMPASLAIHWRHGSEDAGMSRLRIERLQFTLNKRRILIMEKILLDAVVV